MPTIIDQLIVELGLDPSGFTKGQKEAASSIVNTKNQMSAQAKEVEGFSKRVLTSFSQVQNKVVGLFAAFIGGRGVKEFVAWQTVTNAEIARNSRVLGTNAAELSSWRGAAEIAGGTAEGMTGSIQGLVGEFQKFSLTGESGVIPWFRALNIDIANARGEMRPFKEIMLDLADRFSKMSAPRAATFGRAIGLDEGTINLLIKGRIAVAALVEEQDKLSKINDTEAESAEKAQAAWRRMEQAAARLGRVLINVFGSSLTALLSGAAEGISSLTDTAEQRVKRLEDMKKEPGYKDTHDRTVEKFGEPPAWLRGLFGLESMEEAMKKKGFTTPTAPGPAKDDIGVLMGLGWSKVQATGLAANIQAESGGKHTAVGDGGLAYGLGQWHPDRQANFKRAFGKDIRQSTREEQLRFIDWELRNTEKGAGDRLRQSTTAADAAATVSRFYERPKNTEVEARNRANIATDMSRTADVLKVMEAAKTPMTAATASTSTSDVRIGTINVNTRATDAPGIAKDMVMALPAAVAAQAQGGPN